MLYGLRARAADGKLSCCHAPSRNAGRRTLTSQLSHTLRSLANPGLTRPAGDQPETRTVPCCSFGSQAITLHRFIQGPNVRAAESSGPPALDKLVK